MIQSLHRPGEHIPLSRPIRTADMSVVLQDSAPALLPRLYRSHHVVSVALAAFPIARSGGGTPWRGRLSPGDVSLAPAGSGEQVVWPEGARQLHVHLHPRMMPGSIQAVPHVADRRIRDIGRELIEAIGESHEPRSLELVASLAAYVAATFGKESTTPSTIGDYPLSTVLDLLRATDAAPLRIEMVARRVGLSRSHFSRTFHHLVGCSPQAWQMGTRIERAKHMLTVEGRSICETGYSCGFADQSHLTRSFVRWSGLTPARFIAFHRRNWARSH